MQSSSWHPLTSSTTNRCAGNWKAFPNLTANELDILFRSSNLFKLMKLRNEKSRAFLDFYFLADQMTLSGGGPYCAHNMPPWIFKPCDGLDIRSQSQKLSKCPRNFTDVTSILGRKYLFSSGFNSNWVKHETANADLALHKLYETQLDAVHSFEIKVGNFQEQSFLPSILGKKQKNCLI